MGEIRLTDDEFFAALRSNAGLYSRTAKWISEKYQIEYTRQAVYDRAIKQPELLQDIREGCIDEAEDCHNQLLSDPDASIRLKASQFILKTLAKKRGYVERQEVVPMDPDGNALQPIININVIPPVKDQDVKDNLSDSSGL